MKQTSFGKILCILGGAFLLTAIGLWLLHVDLLKTGSQADEFKESVKQQATTTQATPTPSPEILQTKKLDINSATVQELSSLPGIGENLAQRIVAYRQEKPFKVTRDLKKVEGIGDKKFAAISHLIYVVISE